jgi:cytochrome c peroxidase
VELTYPYMHDGRFNTLDEVLDHYTKKFPADSRVDPRLRNGLHLDEEDKADIIAFLKTLTDKTFLYDRRFVDPNTK